MKEQPRCGHPLTAVSEHIKDMKHLINTIDVRIIAREDKELRRKIREAIEIQERHPKMNHDTGYDLPPIYSDLLSCDRRSSGDRTNWGLPKTLNEEDVMSPKVYDVTNSWFQKVPFSFNFEK